MTTATSEEVWYHGKNAHDVAVETPAGEFVRKLGHVVRHSPTGYSWGYAGSGPAELARNLLIEALGPDAKCPTCQVCGNIAWLLPKVAEHGEPLPEADDTGPVPFDSAPSDLIDPDTVGRCYDCDDGYRYLPYQEFKFEVVAAWPQYAEWRISRTEILAWLTPRLDTAAR